MKLVIGIGNEYRSDDGAGIAVARALASRDVPGIEVIEQDGEPVGLMQAWEGHGSVIVVDAVRSKQHPAGTIHRLEVDDDGGAGPAKGTSPGSSHALGAGEAVALARTLDRLPLRLVLVGITGASFEHGLGLTPPVQRAVEQLVDELAGQQVSA